MSQNYQYNTIEEALRDLKEGKIVLVTDDPVYKTHLRANET